MLTNSLNPACGADFSNKNYVKIAFPSCLIYPIVVILLSQLSRWISPHCTED